MKNNRCSVWAARGEIVISFWLTFNSFSPTNLISPHLNLNSTNDLQPSVISDSWLQKHSGADAFHQLFDQYLPQVLEWLQSKKFHLKLQMSRVGIMKCILQSIDGKFASKESFSVGLLRGLGSLIEEHDVVNFAQEVIDDFYIKRHKQLFSEVNFLLYMYSSFNWRIFTCQIALDHTRCISTHIGMPLRYMKLTHHH